MKTEAPPAEEAPVEAPRPKRRSLAVEGILIPLLALFSALVVGGIVMIFTNPEVARAWASFGRNPGSAVSLSWELVSTAYGALFRGAFGSPTAISETLLASTPLILAGLSVALAFRAGMFNIGAEGQIIGGMLVSSYVGFTFDLPFVIHLPLALVAGFLGGALWGAIPGFLKARTGAHEVITTIMLNFIALNLLTFFLKTPLYQRPGRDDPLSKEVAEPARLPSFGDFRVNWGIVLALVVAFAVWYLLFRTTIGFRFRAVGANPNAAAYAGMGVAGTYVLAMAVAGGLSGLAGTANLHGVAYSMSPGFLNYGFDAIALALLGRTHPFGVVLAALLFGALRAGALVMQGTAAVGTDIIVVIQALIIMFVAAPALVREIYRIRARSAIEQDTFTKSWAS
ncbi:MAG: ABC transporter permease [Actinomycetota bacterium]